MTWPLLPQGWGLVGWLGWAFGIYFASLAGWTLLRGSRPKHAQKWMNWIGRLKNFKQNVKGIVPLHAAILFSIFVMGSLLLGAAHGTAHQLHNVYVIGYDSDYHYHMRTGNTEFWTTFCHDYEPQFSTGQTLLVLTYEDMGKCWSIANTHPAYLIMRDEHGTPILR